jgi:hypothetical protein
MWGQNEEWLRDPSLSGDRGSVPISEVVLLSIVE